MDGFLEYNYLSHYGVLGMKWGVRRYQNADGSLTSAGKARYSSSTSSNSAPKNLPVARKKTVTDNSKGSTYRRGKVNTKTSAKESAMNAGGGRYTREYAKINEQNIHGGSLKDNQYVASFNGIGISIAPSIQNDPNWDGDIRSYLRKYGIDDDTMYLASILARDKAVSDLTLDLNGYIPGVYTSLFKELRGPTTASTIFPALEQVGSEPQNTYPTTIPLGEGVRNPFSTTMYELGKDAAKVVKTGKKAVNKILKTIKNAVHNTFFRTAKHSMNFNEQNYLCHYGIKGMKWGIRRYQNPDGSLTAAGIQRYGSKQGLMKKINAENKKADILERDWLVKDYAAKRATKKLSKTIAKLERIQKKNQGKPISKKELKLMNRALDEAVSADILDAHAKQAKTKAEEHYNALVNEFGKEAVDGLSDNAIRRGDTIVASAILGGLAGVGIASIAVGAGGRNNSYYGVRSDAKRLEKKTLKNSKGTVNWQMQEKSAEQKPAEPTYKTVSNGKSKARIESSGNTAEDKKVASNISSINKNATKRWVDDNFEYLQKRYPDKSKSELYNSLEVDTVNSNGIVSLKPKTGKGLDDIGYPYVEMDRKTGKIYRGGWDD